MSFLKNLSDSKEGGASAGWETLDSEAVLEAAIAKSSEKPVFLFKHSTSCGISLGAKTRLEGWKPDPEKVSLYYLDLLAHRPISNKIAEVLEVVHQSPQVILLKDGKAIWSTTHHAISAEAVKGALEKY